MADVRPYRPSNGTEGDIFIAQWCAVCSRNGWSDEDGDACDILTRSFVYPVDDPDYPQEWVMGDRGPGCTAFALSRGEALPLDPAAVVRPLL
jgi:hypothetical protein